jgi:hypothetical protein
VIKDYLKVRDMMAENGYEHTPEEAKEMCDEASKGIEQLAARWKDMDVDEMKKYLKFYNKNVSSKDRMTWSEFKEFYEFVIDVAEGN